MSLELTTYTHNGIELVWDGNRPRAPKNGEFAQGIVSARYTMRPREGRIFRAEFDYPEWAVCKILIPKQQAEKTMTTKREIQSNLKIVEQMAETMNRCLDDLRTSIISLPDEPKEDAIKVGDWVTDGYVIGKVVIITDEYKSLQTSSGYLSLYPTDLRKLSTETCAQLEKELANGK